MGPSLPPADPSVFSVCPASFWVTGGWSLAKQIPTNILWSSSLKRTPSALILSRIPAPDLPQVKRGPFLWQNAVVLQSLTERKEWKFFGVLPKADRGLAAAWWTTLLLRGTLPAAFAIAMGVLVGAVQRGDALAGPLAFAGVVFILLQVLTPIHQAVSANLGDRTAAWLYDRLTEACVRPPGMGHLEDPNLTTDLTVARDFDAGMPGPPLSVSMDFIASGLVEMIGGLSCACVLAAYAWWASLLL